MTLLTPSTRRGDGVFYATPRHRRHRRENTVDAGTGKARSFDLAGAALRLLALCDGNGYILARDARLVDYDSEEAPACDVNDAAHANAAAIHTRRQLALRPVETEGERKPSRADRLKRRAALPRHDGAVSFDDRGSDGETKKRKRPRPSPQTRDAALLIERAAPISVRQENPKKGKSAERYELYKAATTAREYVALGGTKADLKYDIQRGWVTVLAPPVVAAGAGRGRRLAGLVRVQRLPLPLILAEVHLPPPPTVRGSPASRRADRVFLSTNDPGSSERRGVLLRERAWRACRPPRRPSPRRGP